MNFRGTPLTISLPDWLSRLQLSWDPDWDDAKKLKLAIKHLDRTNRKLVPIANHQHTDYQTFVDRLYLCFGTVQIPFHLSRWQEAKRFKGNKFKDWMCSHLAIELVDDGNSSRHSYESLHEENGKFWKENRNSSYDITQFHQPMTIVDIIITVLDRVCLL